MWSNSGAARMQVLEGLSNWHSVIGAVFEHWKRKVKIFHLVLDSLNFLDVIYIKPNRCADASYSSCKGTLLFIVLVGV